MAVVFLAVWRRLAFLQRCLANYNARKKLIKKHSKGDKFIVSLRLNIVKFSLKRSSCKWKEQTFLTKQRMSIIFSIFIVYDSFFMVTNVNYPYIHVYRFLFRPCISPLWYMCYLLWFGIWRFARIVSINERFQLSVY